ncbi:Na+/H+ antiporter subunit E [Thauera sp. CAU 1555]|uniref:Na+/H+ antiporter subunit E n=1 Tax=Thauera sedimentorum TaxID=2767595 RepID=A0ABR9BD57_9RHOO|nr:Na+/H+ antiporter subunit E [Thauera sedimentorum]MDX5382951.1 Na+/H+ antiporter subunit E [Rhodobacterales bacterium]MBC9072262.1 Na+/H+ antiporter subunit E [Thauera sedimentorum]MBD8503181.1 Na+/H+ antiporter subunit E [Thauera sedimentorum]MDX5390274.1 Na+/H+ antiporter subunit E [Rhodobacterales bacterium]MDX5489962.1 Na+/H+ antiporter subunit E [Rhodobacterales bacterium]
MADRSDNDGRSFMQRWLPHPLLTVVLIALWMLLLNNFSAGGLLMGSLLGVVIPIITSNFWPERPPVKAYGKAFSYMALVAWDVVVANLQVARLILFRRADELHVRWVTVPLELRSPEAITVLAGTITMTPGTVSCDLSADGRSLLVHCLDAPDAEEAVRQMKERYEARLMEIFP